MTKVRMTMMEAAQMGPEKLLAHQKQRRREQNAAAYKKRPKPPKLHPKAWPATLLGALMRMVARSQMRLIFRRYRVQVQRKRNALVNQTPMGMMKTSEENFKRPFAPITNLPGTSRLSKLI